MMTLGHRYSKSETRIELSDEGSFRIDERVINYKSVIGYYVNDMSPTQSAMCLRLDTKETIQITSSSIGERGKQFDEAKDMIIEQLRSKNEDLLVLNYQDVYVRQTNILRPLIYATVGLVVILDIAFLYLFIFEDFDLPWQMLLANVLPFSLIPLISKKNKTNLDKFEK